MLDLPHIHHIQFEHRPSSSSIFPSPIKVTILDLKATLTFTQHRRAYNLYHRKQLHMKGFQTVTQHLQCWVYPSASSAGIQSPHIKHGQDWRFSTQNLLSHQTKMKIGAFLTVADMLVQAVFEIATCLATPILGSSVIIIHHPTPIMAKIFKGTLVFTPNPVKTF